MEEPDFFITLSISLSIDSVALGFNDTGYSGCTMLGCPTGQNKALHENYILQCVRSQLQEEHCHPFTPMSIKSQILIGCTDVSDVCVAPSTCFVEEGFDV